MMVTAMILLFDAAHIALIVWFIKTAIQLDTFRMSIICSLMSINTAIVSVLAFCVLALGAT